jgi:regulator of ribonuclease activity A
MPYPGDLVIATADVLDAHPDRAQVCLLAFRSFGGRRSFAGRVATVRCHEDNVVVKRRVQEAGEGRVLVVDGGGSLRVALLGDVVAGLAAANGWAGVIVHGAVRDSVALAGIDLGVVALGTNPRPSAKTGDGEADDAVTFGEATFRPGDGVFVDDDGIVVLPAG